LRDSLPIDMLLSVVSVLVVAQSGSEVPEGLMNNPVFTTHWDVPPKDHSSVTIPTELSWPTYEVTYLSQTFSIFINTD